MSKFISSSKGIDWWFSIGLSWLMGVAALLLFLIVFFLVNEAWHVLQGGLWTQFFNADGWYPLENKLGLLPMLWATLAVSLGALILAFPLGLGCAIFIEYYAPRFIGKPFSSIVTLLAGIPSVVFGLWGLTELVPLINKLHPPGASLLAAVIVLTLMILPTITVTSRSALSSLPSHLLQNSAALALSRKSMITSVLVPSAFRGIVGGVLLALVRALGETMAVLMVAGNVVQTPSGLFDPVRVLTANIALEMAYATDNHRAALFASGLLLMMLVFFIAWIANRLSSGEGSGYD